METSIVKSEKVLSVWNLLKYTYGLVPIIAGLDKYSNVLVKWGNYLNPSFLQLFSVGGEPFMHFIGIVEIIAGIIVLANPLVGGYLVMIWLVAIAANLISTGTFYDIAVRDLTMAIGAFSLAQLSAALRIEKPALNKEERIQQRQPSESMQPTETLRRHEPIGQLETAL